MKRFRRVHYFLCLILLFGVLGGLFGGQVAFATQKSSDNSFLLPPNQEQPPPPEPPEEKLELVSQFPVLRGESGSSYDFEVEFHYQGSEPRVFEFLLPLPPEWRVSIKPGLGVLGEETVLAIRLQPFREYPEKVKIEISPLPGNLPEPGDYVFTFEAFSGNLKDSTELKAIVTEMPLTYELDMVTTTGRLDTLAKASEENSISIRLTNSGTGAVEDITFSSVKSEGWGITFTPTKVESLEPGLSQEVEVVITPPSKTISGDYRITLTARGEENASDNLALRVRVQTPTVWGGAGIGIVVAVITGLVFLFRKLGRR